MLTDAQVAEAATALFRAELDNEPIDPISQTYPEAEVEDTRALVKQVMESVAHLEVPLVVDAGAGHNWDEAH